MTSSSAIDVRGLAKYYGRVRAVEDLTLQVERGEIFGFLGPNGAGKTTSVKMLVGLARPTGGGGTVLGSPLGDRRARQRLGYLPELFRYQEWLTAREVLRLHCRLIGLSQTENAMTMTLESVGLAERGDDRVASYSKGMQQRLGLGVALLGAPELVILDEPTSALDPIGRHDVRAILRELRARGTTVFLNSHLLTEVELVCDRVAIVAAGRVMAQGSVAEVVGQHTTVRIRAQSDGTPLEPVMQCFGSTKREGEGYSIGDMDAERVPELIAALVEVRARIFSVQSLATSLEERFLQIIGASQS